MQLLKGRLPIVVIPGAPFRTCGSTPKASKQCIPEAQLVLQPHVAPCFEAGVMGTTCSGSHALRFARRTHENHQDKAVGRARSAALHRLSDGQDCLDTQMTLLSLSVAYASFEAQVTRAKSRLYDSDAYSICRKLPIAEKHDSKRIFSLPPAGH